VAINIKTIHINFFIIANLIGLKVSNKNYSNKQQENLAGVLPMENTNVRKYV